MTFYWPYVAPLFVITALSFLGSAQMLRTAVAIFVNWAIGTAFVIATGIYDPWPLSFGLDAVTAWIILYHPAGRAQSAIGWTYMAQIIMHAVYAVSNRDIAAFAYWQTLTWLAMVQLLLLGGWISGFWWRRYFGHRWNPFGADPDGDESMAR